MSQTENGYTPRSLSAIKSYVIIKGFELAKCVCIYIYRYLFEQMAMFTLPKITAFAHIQTD